MNITIPTYLQSYAENVEQLEAVESQLQLCSSTGNKQFEIWYYGDLLQSKVRHCLSLLEQPLESLQKTL